jgi:FkbM family methyltransferase
MKKKWVFDIGMNNGEDTKYYLSKGYNVVAIEANEELCSLGRIKFFKEIEEGKLFIINKCVSEELNSKVTFWINKDNNNISSVNYNWANRNNDSILSKEVLTCTLNEIIKEYTLPFYIKIDIEGADITALKQLKNEARLPQYISIEDCYLGYEYIELLNEMCYKKFKLINQYEIQNSKDEIINFSFSLGSSGKFGDDLDGKWMDYEEFKIHYENIVRDSKNLKRKAKSNIWWDIHASL